MAEAHDLWAILATTCQGAPSSPALVTRTCDGEKQLDYQAVKAEASALGALAAGRCGENRVLGIMLPNCIEHVIAYHAAAYNGLVFLSLNYRLPADELEYILSHSETGCLLADVTFFTTIVSITASPSSLKCVLWSGFEIDLEKLQLPQFVESGTIASAALSRRDWEGRRIPGAAELAWLNYTSGTTGKAKGCMHTYAGIATHARNIASMMSLRPTDVVMHIAPLFHAAAGGTVWPVTLSGGCHAVAQWTDGKSALIDIAAARTTCVALVPAQIALMIDAQENTASDMASLRLVLFAGAPMAEVIWKKAAEMFKCELASDYGMTELGGKVLMGRAFGAGPEKLEPNYSLATVTGRPLPGIEIRIVNGTKVVSTGEVAELQVKGPFMKGYLHDPEKTKATITEDGYLRTGDLASLDDHGFVTLRGRDRDMLICAGENVYTAKVEACLLEHALVKEATVFGRQHDVLGEVPVAAVILRENAPGSVIDELTQFCSGRLAAYEVPHCIAIVERIPKTPSGKVQKFLLKEAGVCAEITSVDPMDGRDKLLDARDNLSKEDWSAKLLDTVLGVAKHTGFEVGPDQIIAGDGGVLNSIGALRFAAQVQKEMGVTITPGKVIQHGTLRKLALHLEALLLDAHGCAEIPKSSFLDALGWPRLPFEQSIPTYREALPAGATIVVTGATGFLGIHLVASLLQAGFTVAAIVRSASVEDARRRVASIASKYRVVLPELTEKLQVFCGDVAQPRLGMTDEHYEVCSEADAVIHLASMVNWMSPYSELEAANVGSTVECLKLCCSSRPKLFLLASSVGVLPLDGKGTVVLDENFPMTDPKIVWSNFSGYCASKYVSEGLVRLARVRGLSCRCLRTAFISTAIKTGAVNADDFPARLVHAMAVLRGAPEQREASPELFIDAVSVDHAVDHFVNALQKPTDEMEEIQHVAGPNGGLSIRTMRMALEAEGYDCNPVAEEEWVQTLAAAGSKTRLAPLLNFFPDGRFFPRPTSLSSIRPSTHSPWSLASLRHMVNYLKVEGVLPPAEACVADCF